MVTASELEPPLPWERMEDETARAYSAFRVFRELGPLRSLGVIAEQLRTPLGTVQKWSDRWHWFARAVAWDDECNVMDDRARLVAIRTMHEQHAAAGRLAIEKAVEALNTMKVKDIPANAAARLLELGSKLERGILTVSVEQLQGKASKVAAEDPFEAIARELAGNN